MSVQSVTSKERSRLSNDPIRRTQRRAKLKRYLIGYSFVAPWLIGFLAFTVGPTIASLYLSFTKFDMLSAPKWIGAHNYVHMFTTDPLFWTALRVTFKFVAIAVPLQLAFALFIAILLSGEHKGIGVYRAIFYVPSIIGGSVAVAEMWKQLFGFGGAINAVLQIFGVKNQNWIATPSTALLTIVILVIWQFGSPMLIFLAGLKQIPDELYEAASIDGATRWKRFTKITLPMLTPLIFFNLVMQIIAGFMTFTQGYLITNGGPMNGTLFYALYLYQQAFTNYDMGYASAMAWVLLLIIGVITALVFKSSSAWVYYESEVGD